MQNKIIKIKNNDSGFTLVEVLISLTLFSIAVTGVITAAVQGGMNIDKTKNHETAVYLADEGIELVRALRDTAILFNGTPSIGWASFINAVNTNCLSGCDIDAENTQGSPFFPQPANITYPCFAGGCQLYYDDAGFYTNRSIHCTVAGGCQTPFKRRLSITPMIDSSGNTNEVSVNSTVRWQEGISWQTFTQQEYLYNWYPQQ